MGKILTISIAAYNVEQYIRKTLDSLIDERIIDDLEIFVIDDGGTDGTLEIAQEYANRYPQSIFPIHKENGGYGSTINYSIAHATGKYFKLLDGDDWFETDGLVCLLLDLQKSDSDMFWTPHYRIYEKNGRKQLYDKMQGIESGIYLIDNIDISRAIWMHYITYKTQILKDADLRITEHCFYTDTEYALFPLSHIKSIHISHTPVYCYRVGLKEQSMSIVGIRKHFNDHTIVLNNIFEWYARIEKSDSSCKNIAYQILKNECAAYYRYLCILNINWGNKTKLQEFDRKLRSNPSLYKELATQSQAIRYLRKTKFLAYPIIGLKYYFKGSILSRF